MVNYKGVCVKHGLVNVEEVEEGYELTTKDNDVVVVSKHILETMGNNLQSIGFIGE